MSKTKDKSIGKIIRRFRLLKGLTQEDLAELLDLSYQQVQKYEYNTSTPTIEKLIKISKVLEIPIEVFFKEDLKNNLLDKLESDVIKNYEFIRIIEENPELQELLHFYAEKKTALFGIDLIIILKNILNMPKDQRKPYINIISEISALIN